MFLCLSSDWYWSPDWWAEETRWFRRCKDQWCDGQWWHEQKISSSSATGQLKGRLMHGGAAGFLSRRQMRVHPHSCPSSCPCLYLHPLAGASGCYWKCWECSPQNRSTPKYEIQVCHKRKGNFPGRGNVTESHGISIFEPSHANEVNGFRLRRICSSFLDFMFLIHRERVLIFSHCR